MKKLLVVSGLFVMLLSTGLSQAEAQVRININTYPPGYFWSVNPNYGYNANPYFNQRYGGGGCGNRHPYRGYGYGYGYNNGCCGGRGRHGHGHHGCR